VKKRRKIGEEYVLSLHLLLLAGHYGEDILLTCYRYLRSALTSIGTLATDVTRRLDYTYYNLLEKITALNSTISSFQELSDSASTLLNDFERETAGLDQDIRKQINDLQGFTPQIEKADALEQRMKAGRQRVEELGKRLEAVRHEIDSWEQRETEWQMRTTRRLRIWGIALGAMVILVLALVFQSQNQNRNQARNAFRHPQLERLTALVDHDTVLPWDSSVKSESDAGPNFPPSLADRRESLANAGPGPTSTGSEYDPLRVLDEL
jgi:tetrahydromethanopterin S-methyltransferase subunit B